jgi:hypothetical protein
MQSTARKIAQLQARHLKLTAAFNAARGRSRDVPAEVALGLAISEHVAAAQLVLAETLTTRLPATLAAMERGDIDSYKASKVADATSVLSDEKARQVDQLMSSRLTGKNPSNLRKAVNRVVAQVDPEGASQRAVKRRAGRKLELIHGSDGMASLFAELPVEAATAIYTRVDRAARALKTRTEGRTLDQLRADVFADRCLNGGDGSPTPPKAEIFVYVDLATLAGLNRRPAELAGHGPIPAWLARQIAFGAHSTWRRVVTDPVASKILDVGRDRYRPPRAIVDRVHVRDRECRHPGCNRPAQHCHLDHRTPWAGNGRTAEGNLDGYCARHHRLKHHPGWTYTVTDGVLTVRTPTGATYTAA